MVFYIDDCRREAANISILGGFIVSESAYQTLQRRYREIKANYGLTPGDPAKWSPPRRPEFNKQRSITRQNDFRREVLALLGQSPIKVLASIIEERGRYNNEQRNQYLCSSLEFLAQRFQREIPHGEIGRMVVEYPGEYHE